MPLEATSSLNILPAIWQYCNELISKAMPAAIFRRTILDCLQDVAQITPHEPCKDVRFRSPDVEQQNLAYLRVVSLRCSQLRLPPRSYLELKRDRPSLYNSRNASGRAADHKMNIARGHRSTSAWTCRSIYDISRWQGGTSNTETYLKMPFPHVALINIFNRRTALQVRYNSTEVWQTAPILGKSLAHLNGAAHRRKVIFVVRRSTEKRSSIPSVGYSDTPAAMEHCIQRDVKPWTVHDLGSDQLPEAAARDATLQRCGTDFFLILYVRISAEATVLERLKFQRGRCITTIPMLHRNDAPVARPVDRAGLLRAQSCALSPRAHTSASATTQGLIGAFFTDVIIQRLVFDLRAIFSFLAFELNGRRQSHRLRNIAFASQNQAQTAVLNRPALVCSFAMAKIQRGSLNDWRNSVRSFIATSVSMP
ncbi:uncharacterized protein CLUP02_13204 [Colletotrichum lupini]|uniref:Uncharacterized protein n=1 Tax=Colletotrichum lupini TaxID=145971 RepID=A0A9Q8T2N4_9PEZI|nr:uncharacterized protein CLUP02_13204 [Colletotrichum lupini]UQC87685.1 hypothetical protein CLUP02_13204 [Colletotrichum lupini]